MKEFDYPIFDPSSVEELKATVTYAEFIRKRVKFKILPYKRAFSIFRRSQDVNLLLKIPLLF